MLIDTNEALPPQDIQIILDESLACHGYDAQANQDRLHAVFALFSSVDQSKTTIRVVGFYDDQYSVAKDEDVTTLTVGIKKPSINLALALCEITSAETDRALGDTTKEIIALGDAANDFMNKSALTFGLGISQEAFPAVVVAGGILKSRTPAEKRARKMARKVKEITPITITSQ